MSEWQPIESAPKHPSYLVWLRSSVGRDDWSETVPRIGTWSCREARWYVAASEKDDVWFTPYEYHPTHWMSL
jgi:hypothetical protein